MRFNLKVYKILVKIAINSQKLVIKNTLSNISVIIATYASVYLFLIA